MITELGANYPKAPNIAVLVLWMWLQVLHTHTQDRFTAGQHLCYSNDCFPLVLQCQRVRQHYHYRLMELLLQLGGLNFNVCLHLISKGRWDSLSNTHQPWSGFSANVIRDYAHVTYIAYVTSPPAFLPARFEEKVLWDRGENARFLFLLLVLLTSAVLWWNTVWSVNNLGSVIV